jgi:hypothetical protein
MDIVERLKEDAAHHLDTAEYADGDPKNTINYRYYLNNFEAVDEIERLREALRSLSYIHDGNPSDEWAMVPELAYARHMLFEVRQIARATLKEKD